MKSLWLTYFLLLSTFVNAQNITALKQVSGSDSISNGTCIIYGSFIQRLGFTSGGYPQDIRIENTETKEVFSFRVKPTFKSAKENTFCFSIKPGTYTILNYWFTQSKWYGGKMFTEPVINNENRPYTFTVNKPLNYLGTWHFKTKNVSFSADKTVLDAKLKSDYNHINFETADTVLPVVLK
ncbi:hypothetical protein ACFQ3S_18485 [Mucilaginibacter terrae]|uniref:hypothetical protein n=1 Tax=Mucilaginibacter terrae TaxID=1955052 RepID=UPI00363FB28D